MSEEPHAADRFKEIIDKMPEYLRELERCPAIKKGNDRQFHPGLPTDIGIYVFYEGEKPMYVGRSGRVQGRLFSTSSATTHWIPAFAGMTSYGSESRDRNFAQALNRKPDTRNLATKDL